MPPVLGNRALRRTIAMYAAAVSLEWIGAIAILVTAFAVTGSTLATAVVLATSKVVPAGVLGALAKRLDASPARTTIARGLIAQAGALAIVAAGTADTLPVLIALSLVAGTGGAFVSTGLRTAVARAGLEQLRGGNAALNIVRGFVILAGPLVGGALVAVADPRVAAGVVTAGAGVLALLVSAIRDPSFASLSAATPADDDEHGAREPGMRRRSTAPTGLLLAALGGVLAVACMDEAVLLAFSERDLGAGVAGYSALTVAWGGGILIGGVLFARMLGRPMIPMAAMAATVVGVGLIALGMSANIYVAVAACVLGGTANGVDWPALCTAVQESAAPGTEARVAARLEAVASAAPALGILLGGALAEVAGNRATIILSGSAIPVVILGVLVLARLARPAPLVVPDLARRA